MELSLFHKTIFITKHALLTSPIVSNMNALAYSDFRGSLQIFSLLEYLEKIPKNFHIIHDLNFHHDFTSNTPAYFTL